MGSSHKEAKKDKKHKKSSSKHKKSSSKKDKKDKDRKREKDVDKVTVKMKSKHDHSKHKKRQRSDSSDSSSSSSTSRTGSPSRRHSGKVEKRPKIDQEMAAAEELSALPHAMQLLVKMMCRYPSLPPELGELLDALDRGEDVVLEGVADVELRETLASFLSAVDCSQKEGVGAFSFQQSEDENGGLLKRLCSLLDETGLTSAPLPLPGDVASATLKLVTGATESLGTEVAHELPGLLERIAEGEIVVLEGLENEVLQAFLSSVFTALGLELQDADGNSGYGLPKDQLKAENSRMCAYAAASVVGETFVAKETEREVVEKEESEEEECGPKMPQVKGPARPAESLLRQAAEMSDAASGSDSEGDDGPLPAGQNTRAPRIDPFAQERRRQELEQAKARRKADTDAAESPMPPPAGREEWMLVPPKSLGVLGTLKTLMPTARKFTQHSARGVRNAVGEAPEQKSRAQLEDEAAANDLLERHRAKRGPSLAVIHAGKSKEQVKREKAGRELEERQRLAKSAAETGAPPPPKKQGGGKGGKDWGWNREEDFNQMHKSVDSRSYKEMLEKSKELDSKFSKAISRSFM